MANVLRLLKLPEDVRQQLPPAGSRWVMPALSLSLSDTNEQTRLARDVVTRSLSVRETEAMVRKTSAASAEAPSPAAPVDVHTKAAEDQLRVAWGRASESSGRAGRAHRDRVRLRIRPDSAIRAAHRYGEFKAPGASE